MLAPGLKMKSAKAQELLITRPVDVTALAAMAAPCEAARDKDRKARSQAAQQRWLKRLGKKRWRPVANELIRRGKSAEPMSRAELYLHFKRIGNLAVFWSLYPHN